MSTVASLVAYLLGAVLVIVAALWVDWRLGLAAVGGGLLVLGWALDR